MPKPLSDIINRGSTPPAPPMRASVMGERAARVMGASLEREKAYDDQVGDQTDRIQELAGEVQKQREVKREARKTRLSDMMGQAQSLKNDALASYGREVDRPMVKDSAGRVIPAQDDATWEAELAKRETDTLDTVRKERETERKAQHVAKVSAAKLEVDRIDHQASDPALKVLPDTERKRLDEEVTSARNAALSALLPEIEKRVAARHGDDEVAKEAALASARMGQFDPEIVSELERDMPEAFAGVASSRNVLSQDDEMRAKRDELLRKKHEAAGQVLALEGEDPLNPSAPKPKDHLEAGLQKLNIEKRHTELATRAETLAAREQGISSTYEQEVAAADNRYNQALLAGRVTKAQQLAYWAEHETAVAAALSRRDRERLALAPEKARQKLDEDDFRSYQEKLNAKEEPKPAPVEESTVPMGQPAAEPVPVIDRGDGVKEIEITPDSTKPTKELIASAAETARQSGAEVYLRPDADPEAPSPARLAPEEVEGLKSRAAKAIETSTKQLEEAGTAIAGEVASGKLDEVTARSTFEARQSEALKAASGEINTLHAETFDALLGGRMSLGQAKSVMSAAGIAPEQVDEMVSATLDRSSKLDAARKQVDAVYAKGAAPQKDLLTSGERARQKLTGRLTGQEGAAGVGRALADSLSLPSRLVNIFRDTTGKMGGDKAAYQAEAVANRTADIQTAMDETLSRHEAEVAGILAQYPDLSEQDATKIKLDSARRAIAGSALGIEEVMANLIESPESYLPFVGDLVGVSVEMAPVISAAVKARRGEDLNETDEFFLESYIEGAGRDHSALGLAAEIVTQLPAFGIEIAATGGIGSAVRKGVAKGLKVELRKEVMEGLNGWALKRAQLRLAKEQGFKGLMARGAASLVGTTFQTPFAMADKIAADMITKMTVPDLKGFDGDVQEWVKEPGMGFGHAVANVGYDAWVEMVSETAGGLLRLPSGLTNRLAKTSWVKAAAKLNPAYSTTAIGKFARRAQLHGPIGEVFEERIGDAMRGIAYTATEGDIGTEFKLPDSTQWAGEAIGMLAGNMGFAAINARATAEGKRANRRLFEQNNALVASFGDWSNTAQVADALNGALGRDPAIAPFTAEEIEAIESNIGPLGEMPAVRAMQAADQRLAEIMDRAEAMDDLETLGRATTARVAHTRQRAGAAMDTLMVHREVGRAAQTLAEMGAPVEQVGFVTGSQKLAAGRPLAELTAAERAAWMPQPVALPDGTVQPAPVLVEEVNGVSVVTDAGKAQLAETIGQTLTTDLLPMPESKARRLALNPKPEWKPQSNSSNQTNGSPSRSSAPSSGSPASSAPSSMPDTVGTKTRWTGRGEQGTVVEIPAAAANSLEEAERQLAAQLPQGEMLLPDSVEPPSVKPKPTTTPRDQEEDADEIPGINSAQTDSTPSEPRPLDPVREQVATLGLAPKLARNAETLISVIEGLGGAEVFESIEFTESGLQGMEVTSKMGLRVNLAVLDQQVHGGAHLVTAVIEEIIHGAALRLPNQERIEELWRSAPGALKKTVLQAYRYDVKADQGELSDLAMGHELLRMVVQDKAFRAKITEATNANPGFGEKLRDLLRDLVNALRKHLAKLDKKQSAELQSQVETVITILEELGVAVNREAAPESAPPSRRERGISPLEGNQSGAQRITGTGASPAEVSVREPRLLGSTGTAYTSTGEPIEFQWAVVEAGDLITSNNDNLSENPEYDQNLQNRDRDTVASSTVITDIEANTTFGRLSDSGETSGGAPIVGPDLLVESGNGRSIGIRRAYRRKRENVTTYKGELAANAAKYGFEPDAIEALKQPILVRVRRTEVDREAFARDANQPPVARLSPQETAIQDAKGLPVSLLEQLEVSPEGDLYTPANRSFFQQFFRLQVSGTELPTLVDTKGNLSKPGLDRVRNAVFAAAYGTDPRAMRLLDRLVEDINPEQRNIVNAMVTAAPEMARYRAGVEAGSRFPTTFPEDLLTAADELIQSRLANKAVEEWLGQDRMFEAAPTPEQITLLRFLDENLRSGRRLGLAIRNTLALLEAAGNPQEAGMFDQATPPVLSEIIEEALSRSTLVGSEQQSEMALAMGAPREPHPAIQKGFPDWEYGFDDNGLPNPPATLPEGHSLLQQTRELTTAELPEKHPLVLAGLLPAGTTDRKAFRAAVIDFFLAEATPLPDGVQPTVFATGGGGGAGKSSILAKLKQQGMDFGGALTVNADDIKELIPEFALFAAAGDGRGAFYVHEESSAISKDLLRRATTRKRKQNYNVIFDATLANAEKTQVLFTEWKTAGFRIHLIGVTVDPYEAMVRASLRAKDSMRWVPNDALAEAHAGFNGSVKSYLDLVDSADIWDNTPPEPKPIARLRNKSLEITNETLYLQIDERGLQPQSESGFPADRGAEPGRRVDEIRPLQSEGEGGTQSGQDPASKGDGSPSDLPGTEDSISGSDARLTQQISAPVLFPSSLGIPRSEMPQLRQVLRPRLFEELAAAGVEVSHQRTPLSTLQPTQAEYYPAKVARAGTMPDTLDRRIIVSGDGYILDGHHQYVAALEKGDESVMVTRINTPVREGLALLKDFEARHPRRSDSLAMGQSATYQAEQFDLLGYQAPDGGIRRIPRTKSTSNSQQPTATVTFQGNLFDWQPEAKPDTVENDGSGNRTGRVGSRTSAGASSRNTTAGSPQRDQGGELGDLFAWGGGPTRSTSDGGTGQRPGGRDRERAGGDGIRPDEDLFATDGGGTGSDRPGPDSDRPVGDSGVGVPGSVPAGQKPEKPRDLTPPKVERPTNPADRNHVIPDGFEPSPGGAKARIEANFSAIKLLRALEDEGRNPSPEEKEILTRYTGWGSFKEAFNKIVYAKSKGDLERANDTYGTGWDADGENNYREWAFTAKKWMDRHGELHERLLAELTPEEFASASKSIKNAHFTAVEVVDAVWNIARKAGFRGGKVTEPAGGSGLFIGRTPQDLSDLTAWEAVELDEVTARLLSKLYPEARVNSTRPDPARILGGQGFQDAKIANNSQDLVISNVPFAKVGPGVSKQEFGIAFNLHNYFFAKALSKVKPGGLVVFITTHNTMDAAPDQRRWLARHGELVHAVRLPNTAFKKNAGTEVVTDIIVLRKPDGSGKAPVDQAWTGTMEVGSAVVEKKIGRSANAWTKDIPKKSLIEGLQSVPVGWTPENPDLAMVWAEWAVNRPGSGPRAEAMVAALEEHGIKEKSRTGHTVMRLNFKAPIEANQFYEANPHLVVGQHTLSGSMYREDEYNVEPPAGGEDAYREALQAAVDATPDVGRALDSPEGPSIMSADAGDRVGSFLERDGVIYQVQGNRNTNEARSLVPMDWKPAQVALWRSWDKLRESTEELIALELAEGSTDGAIAQAREKVNRLYDLHVGKYGNLANPHRQTNKARGTVENKNRFLETDSRGYPLLQSLEVVKKDVDPATGIPVLRYKKAPILLGRVLNPIVAPTSAESIEDALSASMGFFGTVDLAYMARILNQEPDAVKVGIMEAGYAFEDPLSGLLVLADEYLSGNVVEKLHAAEAAAESDPGYQRNVEALEAVRPAREPVSNIGINLGATWIPAPVYEAFMSEVLEFNSPSVSVTVAGVSVSRASGGSADFSTDDKSTAQILASVLTFKPIRIRRNLGTKEAPQWVVDEEATALANTVASQMKAAFTNWVRSTTTVIDGRVVGEIVATEYHEKVNTMRPPTYKGDWVKLPDQSGVIWLKAHRRAVLARMLTQGYGMMAHGVGSGKTFNLIALSHELKRMGRARKPMIVAMNSTVAQFAASYKQAYPQANLLVADINGNFNAKNRALFYAQAATGDWDAIIVPHSTLKLIPNNAATVREFFQAQIAEMESALATVIESGDRSSAQNNIQDSIDSLNESMTAQLAGLQKYQDGNTLFWEDLGIDALLVDEAHAFKNAPVVTMREGMKNLPSGVGSDNAMSMQMKAAAVQARTGGKHVFFATGTPITNSMSEAYVMIRYLAPHLLYEKGIHNFDDFVNLFGDAITKPEASWRGEVEMTTRLTKFVNGRSLIDMIRSVFDVALGNASLGLDVPRVRSGAAIPVLVPASPVAEEINDWILDTADAFDSLPPRVIRENPRLGAVPIVTMGSGVAAATDPRLISRGAPDHPGSKVNTMLPELLRLYREGEKNKTAQVIFSDLRNSMSTDLIKGLVGYVPFEEESEGLPEFDLFEDIAQKLVAGGVPREQIWWPTNEKDDVLAEKFAAINRGDIRFVLGSTAKIGTGVNFQERLVAAHHLGPPRDMKPAMMEQRNGRIIRQGNLHAEWGHNAFVQVVEKAAGRPMPGEEPMERREAAEKWLAENGREDVATAANEAAAEFDIFIYEYALEKSMDSAIFGMMAAKQGMIAQSLSAMNTEAEFADPADAIAFAMAEQAANTLGDASLIRMVTLEREVREARGEASAFASKLGGRLEQIRALRANASLIDRELEWVASLDGRHRGVFSDPAKPPLWKIGATTVDQANKAKDAPKLLETLDSWISLMALQKGREERQSLRVGDLVFDVVPHPLAAGAGYLSLQGSKGFMSPVSFNGARGLVTKIRDLVEEINRAEETGPARKARDLGMADKIEAEVTAMGDTWEGAAGLAEMERELAELQVVVRDALAAAKEARLAKRNGGGQAAQAIVAETSGTLAAPEVTRIWADMQERREPVAREVALGMGASKPHLDLTADWSTWPLAEIVMDIAGIPAKSGIRPLMRKKPKLAPLVKHAGGEQALERALGNAGIAMGGWHGTPHKVDQFSVEKIGTGEGAQAYGWGLYFAESREVGEEYQNALSSRKLRVSLNGRKTTNYYLETTVRFMAERGAVVTRRSVESELQRLHLKYQNASRKEAEYYKRALDSLQKATSFSVERDPGNLYRVDIKADPETEFLDWDKSLGEQTPKIREAFLKAMEQSPKNLPDGFDLNRLKGTGYLAAVGTIGDRHDDKVASERMLAAGIKGIRYLDGNSRRDGEGTRNFVVFDDSLVEILEKNGQPVSKAVREETLRIGRPASSAPRDSAPDWNDEEAIRSTLDYFSRRLPSPAAMDRRRREIGERTTGAEASDLILDTEPDKVDIRREIAVVRDVQIDNMRIQTHEQWNEEARELIARDYDGVVRALLEHAREGEPITNPALVKAAQIIIPRVWRHAKSTGDKQEMRDAQALTLAYLEGGTSSARVLGARRDMFKTDAERHVDFLSQVFVRLPNEVRKRAEMAPTPAAKRRKIEELNSQLSTARKEATGKSAEVEALEARIESAKAAGKAGLAEIARLNKELQNVKSLHNASAARAKASIQRLGAALGEVRKQKDRAEILGEAHEARLAKVEGILREMGLTLHDIFSHQAVARLRGSEIVARVIEENFSAPQRAAIRFKLPPEGLSEREIEKRTGVKRDAVPGLMAQFQKKIEARFMELAKKGFNLESFMSEDGGNMFDLTNRIGEQGQTLRLGTTTVSDAEAAAATKEMMAALFGGVEVTDKRTGRKPNAKPFDIGNKVHVAQVAATVRAAIDGNTYDMLYEGWINNILSGPQTHAVNITGNALNIALEYGMQRWLEATWNTVIGDPKGATFGEYGHIFRSIPNVWAKSFASAAKAWASEESYLEQELLREPAKIGGVDDKAGGGRRAIPDRIGKLGTTGADDLVSAAVGFAKGKGWKGASVGRTVRIPGRALLFMDTLFKGVVARHEVAAQAYRTGRANGLQGAALESHIRAEVNTSGSVSWQAAMEKAADLTFTNELRGADEGGGLFEQLVKRLQDTRSADTTLSPLAASIVGWFFPFIRTPFNIYKAGLRRTPFGLVGMASHLLKTGVVQWKRRNEEDGGGPFLENYGKARLARDLTDQTISLIITSILLGMTEGDDDDDDKDWLITGSRPYGLTAKGERELTDRMEGGAFQIRVGKANDPNAIRFDYGRLEPFTTVLGSIADTLRSIKRMENGAAKVDELTKFHQYALSQATDKTFLQGIVKIGELMEPGRSTGSNVARTVAQAIVPNLVRQPLRLLDDYARESRTAPWYYHAVPFGGFAEPKIDLYGQPMEKGGTPLKGLLGPVDRLARIPVDTGLKAAPQAHVADVALRNWNRTHPDKGDQYFPPGNSITSFKDFTGQRQKLTAAQLAEVERIGGTRLRVMLAQSITPAEAANPTEATIAKIEAARRQVFSQARDEVVNRPAAPAPKKVRSLKEMMGWTKPAI